MAPRWMTYRLLSNPKNKQGAEGKTLKGILRSRADGQKHDKRRISWQTVLVGADESDQAERQAQFELEKEIREKSLAIFRMARLPFLTYEELAIPLRIAFPKVAEDSPAFIFIDIIVDGFEILWILNSVNNNKLLEKNPQLAATTTITKYTTARFVRDVLTISVLHIGRALHLSPLHVDWVWYAAQCTRMLRIHDLMMYMRQINNDLKTNVTFLSVFKFGLVLLSVPHWIACGWWLISSEGWKGEHFLPSSLSQLLFFSQNPDLDPNTAKDWDPYIMSSFMAWAGVTAMGYGSMIIVRKEELAFAILISFVQVIFYAFVLGTLFHYLVRADESTVYYKQLARAVEEYVENRKMPDKLARKITDYFEYQHRKRGTASQQISEQLPLSLKVKIAVAQYMRQMQATWAFRGCIPQFLKQVVLDLNERFVMPRETVFNRGDGSVELLWCLEGALNVWKGDQLVSTIRADLGDGQVVGEVSFFIGIQQPYSVVATPASDVTLLVITASAFETILTAYPEQADTITSNILRKYGLDKNGNDVGDGGDTTQSMDEDEAKEFEELRQIIKGAVVDRNEALRAQMAIAASAGDVETVKTLAARGLDLNVGGYDARTTLHLAAAEGNTKVVSLLCELGADVNARDRWGTEPLMDAIEGRHESVADELERNGASVNAERPEQFLLDAAVREDLAHMRLLLAHGVPVDGANYDGRTALHFACARGTMRVAEFLISKLADVNARDRWDFTPVDDAIAHSHHLVADMLIRNGSQANPLRMAERLRLAASQGDSEQMRFLIRMRAAINCVDYDRRTPLHIAARSGSISATQLLVSSMADVTKNDRWGNTPLVDALESNVEAAAILIKHCNATLPERLQDDGLMLAQFQAADSLDMLVTNRRLHDRADRRQQVEAKKMSKRREVGLVCRKLVDELSKLMKTHNAVFRTVARNVDKWIATYAADDSSDDDDDERTDDDDKDDASGLPHLDLPSLDAQDADAPGKNFIRLILQLPKAEEGLSLLSSAFAEALDPDMFEGLPTAERIRVEDATLRTFLEENLGFNKPEAESVLIEVYRELKAFLGDVSPSAPTTQAVDEGPAPAADEAALVTAVPRRSSIPVQHPDAPRPFHRQRSASMGKAILEQALSERRSVGNAVIDLGKLLNNPENSQSASWSKNRRTVQPPDDDDDDERDIDSGEEEDRTVFLSQLGYVVLFCSRRFVVTAAVKSELLGGMVASPSPVSPPLGKSKFTTAPNTTSPAVGQMAEEIPAVAQEERSPGSLRRLTSELIVPQRRRSSSTGLDVSSGSPSSSPMRPRLRSYDSSMPLPEVVGTTTAMTAAAGEEKEVEEEEQYNKLQSAVALSTGVVYSLFRVFDHNRRGHIRIKDVRALQLSLGELGGSEIRSLITYLNEATRSLKSSGHDADDIPDQPPGEDEVDDEEGQSTARGRRSSNRRTSGATDIDDAATLANAGDKRQPKSLSRAQFFVGAASWILSSSADNAAKDDEDDDEDDEDDEERELGDGDGGDDDGVPKNGLSKLSLNMSPLRGAGKGTARQARQGLLSMTEKAAEAEKTSEADIREEFYAVMTTSKACEALADQLQLHMDIGRLEPSDPANAPHFLREIKHTLAVNIAVDDSHVSAWTAKQLDVVILNAPVNLEGPTSNLLRLKGVVEAKSRDRVVPIDIGTTGPPSSTWEDLAEALRRQAVKLRGDEDAEAGTTQKPKNFRHRLALWFAGVLGIKIGKSNAKEPVATTAAAATALALQDKPWFIILHTSQLYKRFHLVFLFLIIYDCLQLPIQLCFIEEVINLHWMEYVLLAVDSVYWGRMVLRLNVTFVNANSVTVTSPALIRRHYLATDCLWDVFAVFPLDHFALGLNADFYVFHGLRAMRLINLRYVREAYLTWQKSQAEDDLLTGLVHYTAILLLAAHLGACVWNLLGFAHLPGTENATWVDQYREAARYVGGEIQLDHNEHGELELVERYLVALYFTISMLSTLGATQVPANYVEILFFTLAMMANLTVYAWGVGKISALVMKQDDEVVGKRAQLEVVHSYTSHLRVPPSLKEEIETFFHIRLQNATLSTMRDEHVFAGLSIALQIEVSRFINRDLVGACSLLRGCSDGFMDRMSSLLTERAVEAETVLFRSGDACRELLLIQSGAVDVYEEPDDEGAEPEVIDSLGPGETLGDVPFVFGIRHFKTARASAGGESRVFVFSHEAYKDILKSFPEQEDIVMDNTMSQYDGMLTSRSGKSKVSGVSGAQSSTGSPSAYSEGLSSASGVPEDNGKTDGESVANASAVTDLSQIRKIISEVKRKREETQLSRLCSACYKGDVPAVRRLLSSSSVDVNRGDLDGRRAIHLAACGGDVQVLELLVAYKADINVVDRHGGTPLEDAIRHNNEEVAQALKNHDADRQMSKAAESLCAAASQVDGASRLSYRVSYKCDVNVCTSDGRSALHLAAAQGCVENVKILISSHADVNAKDSRGSTPLQDALVSKNDACCELLIEKGSKLGDIDVAAQMCIAAANDDVDHLRRLVKHRCAVNVQDPNGRTPLHLASSNGRIAAVHYLLDQQGIDISREDQFGNTPLDDAQREHLRYSHTVRSLLMAHGASVGSHERQESTNLVSNFEEDKADADARIIQGRAHIASTVHDLVRWVHQQRVTAYKLRKATEEVLKIESSKGKVITELRPAYWGELKAFAEEHGERVDFVSSTLRDTAVDFRERFQDETLPLDDILKQATALNELYEQYSRLCQRLVEVDFDKKGDGEGSEGGSPGSDLDRSSDSD